MGCQSGRVSPLCTPSMYQGELIYIRVDNSLNWHTSTVLSIDCLILQLHLCSVYTEMKAEHKVSESRGVR